MTGTQTCRSPFLIAGATHLPLMLHAGLQHLRAEVTEVLQFNAEPQALADCHTQSQNLSR